MTFLDLENDMARYSVDNEVDRGHIRLCAAKALLKWVLNGDGKGQGPHPHVRSQGTVEVGVEWVWNGSVMAQVACAAKALLKWV